MVFLCKILCFKVFIKVLELRENKKVFQLEWICESVWQNIVKFK